MWTCSKCSETIEDEFDSCWKCAAPEPIAPVVKTSALQRPTTVYLLGLLFEFFLIFVGFASEGSWLSAKIYLLHFPLLWFVATTELSDLVLAIPFLMALVWALLFYWSVNLVTRTLVRIPKRQRFILHWSFGLLLAIILAGTIFTALPERPTPFTSSPEVKSSVEANTAFALDLYKTLKEKNENLFFSPYSISTSLAMTYAGARKQTESEIAKALHFNLPQEKLHLAFGALGSRMENIQRWNRIRLTTANSLWCQQGYPFKETFLDLLRVHYKADAKLVDFKHAPQPASGEINNWIERKTNGKIKNVITPDRLTADTSLVLCNAIYFKGKWATQFKPSNTKSAPFSISTNQTVTVPMMQQTSEFKTSYAADDSFPAQLLELPYIGTDLSMIIILPHERDGLADLEQQLTVENLHEWLAKLDQAHAHKTAVRLPRFKTAQSFELKKDLATLGMPSLFDIASADLSGMDNKNNLYISFVIHQTFVEVNEEGTEAGAVTLSSGKAKSMAGRFNVDHPFIFLIRENGSGSILFLGRIVDPTK